MTSVSKQESFILFFGDIFCFLAALWLTLLVRYLALPDQSLYLNHLQPFSILFFVWVIVFFIGGLYEKHTVILKNRLPSVIFNAQIVNSVLAVIFFYFIPYFGITPKTNLFIYLVISFILILFWRIYGYKIFASKKKQNVLLLARGEEMKTLTEEVNNNSRYNLKFVSSVDLDKVENMDFQEILKKIDNEDIDVIAIDFENEKVSPLLPYLYSLMLSRVRFIDINKIYEDIFDRIPLSSVRHNWFLENISTAPKVTYDFLKRVMDIILSLILGLITLIFYPFIAFAVWLESGGPILISQERVGRGGILVRIQKFRTMTSNDNGVYGEGAEANVVTKVGKFLRRTRLDELPQLYNVLCGQLSLIGPRPELPTLAAQYEKEILYYSIRHLIKPGLSGWAQIYHDNHPHHGLAIEQTKEKLSYDLYYLKNRSFVLDVIIALKTIKKLVSRSGA